MIVNHIETGEKLPENILIVIRLLDKEVRDSIIRRYWKAGKESSNNSVILGYHNVQDCHLNMIRAVLKVALPIAKEYVKTMNDTNFIIESEILANQPQTA